MKSANQMLGDQARGFDKLKQENDLLRQQVCFC
jgi:hypothetical protein